MKFTGNQNAVASISLLCYLFIQLYTLFCFTQYVVHGSNDLTKMKMSSAAAGSNSNFIEQPTGFVFVC